MVVRNVVRSPVRAVVQSVFGEGESFHPFQLFTSGAQGAWYDPSDYSTLFQNANGTTPVTAVEQPVRLMLDRSRGLVLGSELVTDGSFAGGTVPAGWTGTSSATLSVVAGELVINTAAGSGFPGGRCTVTTVVGRTYRLILTARETATNNCNVYIADSGGNFVTSAPAIGATNTQFDFYFVARQTSTFIDVFEFIGGAGTGTIIVDNISVRELPGNHATAPNDASRPILRARYNRVLYSEELNNAIWSKSSATVVENQYVDSQGTSTLDRVLPTAGNAGHYVQQNITYTATQHTLSFEASYDNHRWIAVTTWDGSANRNASFDLLNGVVGVTSGGATSSIASLGNGLYRCTVTYTPAASSGNFTIGSNDIDSAAIRTWNAAGTEAFGLGRVSLLTAADQAATGGAYQRVGAATDYDTGPPWRPYLAFDGLDDSMSTSSIDFSGTDEMTVFAGVSKLSDAATQVPFELSADSGSNNGTFAAFIASGVNEYVWRSKGTSSTDVNIDNAIYLSPVTHVLTGIGDISGDVSRFRINGAQVGANTADQGAGNFGNYPLFIGRRNNSSFPFNGRLYSLAVLGRTATAPELTAMESWIAGKTGVSL